MKNNFILVLFFNVLFSFSQDSIPIVNHNRHFGEKSLNTLRFGIGFQPNLYTELGYLRMFQRLGDAGFFSKGYYASFEWVPKTNHKEVFGFKVGYEIATILGAIALEAKYQINSNTSDFLITPKIGISLAGDIFFAYGYTISVQNYPFQNVSKHQLSLVFNLHESYLEL